MVIYLRQIHAFLSESRLFSPAVANTRFHSHFITVVELTAQRFVSLTLRDNQSFNIKLPQGTG